MTEWETSKLAKRPKGHPNSDEVHSKLRVAVMREDLDAIEHCVNILGIPVDAYDNLAEKIAIYHNKKESLIKLDELRFWYIASWEEDDKMRATSCLYKDRHRAEQRQFSTRKNFKVSRIRL